MQLLKISEVARRLEIGRSTAYQLVQAGSLPAVHIGRAVRVCESALDEWITANTRGGERQNEGGT